MKKNPVLILSLAVVCLADHSFSQTLYWDGGSANLAGTGTGVSTGGAGTWNNTIENWDQGAGLPFSAWMTGSNAFFGATGGSVTLGAAVTANVVTITNKSYSFTDGGNSALTLTVNTITNSTGGGLGTPTVISNNIVNSTTLNVWCPGSDLRLDAINAGLAGTIALNLGTLEIGDGSVFNGGFSAGWSAAIATNATLAIRNEVNDTAVANTFSGQGMLEIENKSGVATILTGANTYTGATFIASGSLIITSIDDVNPNPIGTGPLQVGNNASAATFNFQGASAYTTTRPLLLAGNGTSIISGLDGEPIIFAGTFAFGSNITSALKMLELTGAGYGVDALNCNLFDYSGTTLLEVNKQSGTWLLTGSNSFSGGLTFTGSASGALYVTNDFSLGISNGGIFFTNGGGTIASTNASVVMGSLRTITVTTNTAGFMTADTNNLTVDSYITGSGTVSKSSSSYTLGVVRFSNDTNNFTGNFTMGFGNTEFTSVADAGVPCSLGAGGSITNNNSTSFAILRYVGVSNSTTHRPLVWAATTGPLALDNTNTGTIAYLSGAALATGSGAKTLTLQGSNTGTNTLGQVVNDSGGMTSLVKNGAGQWLLTAVNTYSGPTTIDEGALLVNGSISTGAVTVNSSGTLGGSGTVGGAVTVTNGGTLAAGNPGGGSVATLAINNTVTNLGTIFAKLNASAGTSDQFTGISTLVYGGTLSLTNLAGTMSTTNTFHLFSAASYQGGFSSISPATPGPGLAWNTNNLALNGTLGVMAGVLPPSPTITGFSLSGTTIVIQGTNGEAGGLFILLSSTNVALPLSQWTPVLTNSFDGSGNFNVTNNLASTNVQQFFILSE